MMKQRVLVVFVDALGTAQLERFGETLSFVPHRRALGGVLGYSSGALATVLTGAPGSEHGRMCLFSQRSEGEPSLLTPLSWLGILPRVVHERGRLRRMLARVLSRSAGLTGYVALHRVPPDAFRWLDLPEREDIFAAKEIGGVPTFLARAREAGLCVYASPWQLPEGRRWEEIHRTLERDTPDLAFLYAAELDGVLHAEGNDGNAARAVRIRIAEHLERARTAMLRGGGSLLTVLVGDHGMADVHKTIDPRGVVSRIGARVWGDPAALVRARIELERAKLPGVWLDAAALEKRDAPTQGSPYGNALFLLEEGCIFAPSYVGGKARGMHGYDLPSRSAQAAIASDQPLPASVSSLVDLAPMVTSALGL
jgi:hypothetical protein